MKSIRNIALTALLTIGAFSAITYTSCNPDKCKDVVCQNGGTCSEGVCSCPVGYEGTLCETKSNAKFVGVWAVSETCGSAAQTPYQVTITADASDATKILVNNLGNYGCTVGGTITWNSTVNGTSLTIADNKCGTQMNATGTYANGKITITYTATYGTPTTTDNCTATLSK